ncbi:MAG: GTPase, partial [Chthoniobacterales bacterium]
FYEPIIKAKSGGHGLGKKMHGRGSIAKIVNVPVGTIVYRALPPVPKNEFGEPQPPVPPVAEAQFESRLSDDGAPELMAGPQVEIDPLAQQVADLSEDGQEFVLCAGGKGGKGNVHFKSAKNRAPVQYTEGEEGEQGHFLLELRTIADAALVGYPNAGKSTLLGKISAAHPKVAAYPFTTLRPSVGVVELDDYRRATIADIPGLIEGAHRNVGLGHDFLRHITRCPSLFFVVDIAGSEGRHPVEDLQSLRREIDLYDSRLSQKPWCILANKMDLPESDENFSIVRDRFPNVKVIPIAAAKGEGIEEIKDQLRGWLAEEGEPAAEETHEVTAAK